MTDRESCLPVVKSVAVIDYCWDDCAALCNWVEPQIPAALAVLVRAPVMLYHRR